MSTTGEASFKAAQTALKDAFRTGKFPTSLASVVKSKTTDVDGFIKWLDTNTPAPRPPCSAADALTKLKATNFADFAAVATLADAVDGGEPIPLFKTADREYVVVTTRPVLSVAGETITATTAPPPGSKVSVHPYVYDLAQTSATGGQVPLPRFAYALGVLKTRALNPTADTPYEETNYGVVVDVAGTNHAVWLVYNRAPYDVETGEKTAADPAEMPAVFAGVGAPNPDAAQAVAALKNWSVTALPAQTVVEGLVKSTARRGAVAAKAAWIDDLAKAVTLTNLPPPRAAPQAP
ncbi:hypothetical protein B0T24DRAFT_661854 [Lasiosphaeria ovina]|uniref:Uncharacterized protein n=1 Tax=Lasiosphaeria ovina TaxID=92902 RepID=A0AAE0NKP9_9PEZI|nr:hypothetical protein B0T24DRAFT_661854 [Lasiosphaeria ovina]